MLLAALAVALGAALGALLRWALGVGLNHLFPRLPPGTLVANLVGCFAVGLAWPLLPADSGAWRAFIVVGLLGGLTTFSTFSAEIVQRLRDGHAAWALAGVAAHVLGALGATVAGFALAALLRG